METWYTFGYQLKLLRLCFWHLMPFFFCLNWEAREHRLASGSCVLSRPNTILKCVTPVGLLHCSWDSQTSFFSNFFFIIKNGSHDTIHTFKNYFAIVFSIFSFQQNKSYDISKQTLDLNLSRHCVCYQHNYLQSYKTLEQVKGILFGLVLVFFIFDLLISPTKLNNGL